MAQVYQCVLLGEGGRIAHTPTTAIAAGNVVLVKGMFAFATEPIAAGVLGTLRAASGPPLARIVKAAGGITVGNAVYWDANGSPQGGVALSGAATTVATSNTLIGRCAAAAAAAAEYVDVEATIGVVTPGGLENVIVDPTNVTKAIPVVYSGHCALVSLGALETRTLAVPTFLGQMLLLYMKTDGGDIEVTCAAALNETGNTKITFTATGQAALLFGVAEGATLRWRITKVDGAALS